MSPELKDAVVRLLEQTNNGIDTASNQVPIVIEEFIHWSLLTTGLQWLAAFLFLVTSLVLIAFGLKRDMHVRNDPFAAGVILFGFSAFATLYVSLQLIKIYFFSHYYVVQYLLDHAQ